MISLAFSQKGDVIEKTMLLISIIRTDRLRQFLPYLSEILFQARPQNIPLFMGTLHEIPPTLLQNPC